MSAISVGVRVEWWMRDMAYKPPEVISEDTAHGMWYHLCFAKDIMEVARTGNTTFEWSSRRLDPPAAWTGS